MGVIETVHSAAHAQADPVISERLRIKHALRAHGGTLPLADPLARLGLVMSGHKKVGLGLDDMTSMKLTKH